MVIGYIYIYIILLELLHLPNFGEMNSLSHCFPFLLADVQITSCIRLLNQYTFCFLLENKKSYHHITPTCWKLYKNLNVCTYIHADDVAIMPNILEFAAAPTLIVH